MNAKLNSRNSVRIIGGEHGSRRIEFKERPGLRPTGDRVRETLFNWLQNKIPGARCLDLFAGSGALGIESASRGASYVCFIECDIPAADDIEKNVNKLKLQGTQLFKANAELWLDLCSMDSVEPFDIVYIDPPFSELNRLLPNACRKLDTGGLLRPGSLIYIESADPVNINYIPDSWSEFKFKRAGQVCAYLYKVAKEKKG